MLRLVPLLASLSLAPPALAATERSLDADIICMLAANHTVETGKEPQLRNFAGAMKLFYMGRIDARSPEPTLAATLAAQAQRMAQTPPVEEIKLCSSYFADQAAKFITVGKAPPAPKK